MKNQNLYLIGLICTTTLAAPISVVGQPSKTDNTWLADCLTEVVENESE